MARGSFTRRGDWERVLKLTHNLKKEIIEAVDTSLMRFGLKAEKIAKKHISSQDLGWKPLAASTLAEKIRKGYSENILVRTSSYFQAITSWLDRKQNTVYIGVKKEVKHKESGEELGTIAKVHEFGSQSGRIPARPLWQPTFTEVLAWHKKNNDPVKIFLANIKKRYGV